MWSSDLALATEGAAFAIAPGSNLAPSQQAIEAPLAASQEPMATKAASLARAAAACGAAALVAGSAATARRQRRPLAGHTVILPLAHCQQPASTTRRAATTGVKGEFIDDLLKENSVVVFSKSTCPFCAQAKTALEENGVKFFVCELDQMAPTDTDAMQETLMQMTGARTVPRVFISGKSVGGCDDVLGLVDSGKLLEMVPKDAITKGAAPGFAIEMSDDDWFEKLGREKFSVLRQQGTEPPNSHEFNKFYPNDGYFSCGACGLPMYSAQSKFRSNCGWPVFDKCYYSEEAGGCHVGTKAEFGGLEIICKRCESHLGHVFFDAFSPSNPNGERH